MNLNYESIISFAFDWLKTKDSIKILLPYGALCAVMALFGVLQQNFSERIPASNSIYLVGLLVSFGFRVLFVFVSFYFVGLAIVFALKRKQKHPRFFGGEEFIGLIKTAIVNLVCSLVWCQNKKIRAAQVSCLSVLIVSVASLFSLFLVSMHSENLLLANLSVFILLVLVSFLLALAYFLVVAYASTRYCFSIIVFLEKKTEAMDSVRKSWELTRGSVLEILLAWIAAGIVSAIAFGLVAFFLSIFFALFCIIAGASLASFFVFSALFGFFLSWLLFLPQIFIDVAIYENLLASHAKPKK